MTTNETRHVQTFMAKGDSGREYTIDVYQTVVVTGDLDSSTSEQTGLKEFRTRHGELIKQIGRGQYQTVDGQVLRSDDPDAP